MDASAGAAVGFWEESKPVVTSLRFSFEQARDTTKSSFTMAGNDDDDYYSGDDGMFDDDYYSGDDGMFDDDSFVGYIPHTNDPGLLLFLVTTLVVTLFMVIIMPSLVCLQKRRRRRKKKKNMMKALQMQQLDQKYEPPVVVPQDALPVLPEGEGEIRETKVVERPVPMPMSPEAHTSITPPDLVDQPSVQTQLAQEKSLPIDLLSGENDTNPAPQSNESSTEPVVDLPLSQQQQHPEKFVQEGGKQSVAAETSKMDQTEPPNADIKEVARAGQPAVALASLPFGTVPLAPQPILEEQISPKPAQASQPSVSIPVDQSLIGHEVRPVGPASDSIDMTPSSASVPPEELTTETQPAQIAAPVDLLDNTPKIIAETDKPHLLAEAVGPTVATHDEDRVPLSLPVDTTPKDTAAHNPPLQLTSTSDMFEATTMNGDSNQIVHPAEAHSDVNGFYTSMGQSGGGGEEREEDHKEEDQSPVVRKDMKKVKASFKSIVRYDRESRRILRYTIPFTFYAVTNAVLESVCLALIAHFVGTKQVAAYALVGVLLDLSGEFLYGPIYACTTLCAHATGAGNFFLAGQYAQVAVLSFFFLGTPVIVLWYLFVDDVILYLEWGDELVAGYAQDFVKIYIWSEVIEVFGDVVGELLEIQGHEMFTTFVGIARDAANVGAIAVAIYVGYEFTLSDIALLYLATSFFFTILLFAVARGRGWLAPFSVGLFERFSLTNYNAIKPMVMTSVPLAFGSVLSNAEWAILTFFASHLGPAEVAAWAILGSIWEIFEAMTHGIGDAAEIRVSYHLGNNHPYLAKLSAYKSLYIGMVGAAVVSGVFFYVMRFVPAWFTPDDTLQQMIAVTLPYIGVGNLVLTFGYLCWFMIGAQGRYKLGTWVAFVASWGVTLPLGYVFTYVLTYDLQGLTAAVVLGYVGVSVSLSYVLLTSDWPARAIKIYRRNRELEKDEEDEEKDLVEDDGTAAEDASDEGFEVYAALASGRSRAAKAQATRNIRLLVVPAGKIGIQIATPAYRPGTIVTDVFADSPFVGQIFPGDTILAVDGISVSNEVASTVYALLLDKDRSDRHLTVLSTYNCNDEDTKEIMLSGTVPDIPDFEDDENEEALLLSGRLV